MIKKIIAVSDTHGLHNGVEIPDGDLLIHSGDITIHGLTEELYLIDEFFSRLPHKHKVLIAGNHDRCFERDLKKCREILKNVIYLQDESICLEGINIYGSPWQPYFCNWAFNLQRGAQIKEKWDLIPQNTDVLITHGPPYDICDKNQQNKVLGCRELKSAIDRVKPKLHIFGHIHESYGEYNDSQTKYVNASVCDLKYNAVNAPIVIDYTLPG